MGRNDQKIVWGVPIIFALVWLTIAVATVVVLLSLNPELKRMLYNAIAPLRSAINPSQN